MRKVTWSEFLVSIKGQVEHKACGNFHVYTYFLRDEDGDSDICWKSTTIIGAINLFINNARDDIRQSMQLERERKLGLEQDLEDLNAARDRGGSTALWEWILRQGSILDARDGNWKYAGNASESADKLALELGGAMERTLREAILDKVRKLERLKEMAEVLDVEITDE